MRILGLAILLSFGSVAFGQDGSPAPFNPDNLGKFPSPWSSPVPDLNRLPPQWQWKMFSLLPFHHNIMTLPPRRPLADVQIDPKIVVHPSQRDLGVQPRGTLMAQNLYPGLTFQPIESPQSPAATRPLSTVWPQLKVKQIPSDWPKFKLEPVDGNSPPVAKSPAP